VTRVLVTHADAPIGRRVVKRLFHDPRVDGIFALGDGPPPRAFDRFLAQEAVEVAYARVDLARHRAASDLFHSSRFRRARIDTVVHLPRHGPAADGSAPVVGGLSERTAETRLVVQHCLEVSSIRSLIALGSAYVYKLHPGNANRLTERSELDLEPDIAPEIRSWIDADMIVHGEVHSDRLRVVLLRAPTVVAAGGYVFMNPALPTRGRRAWALGFDPICSVISDKDVAGAVLASVHSRRSGIYNIAGREAVPLSVLARWTGHSALPLPRSLLSLAASGARLVGLGRSPIPVSGAALRYGFTLDTRLAELELGFHPGDRIGLARAGDGTLRLETAASATSA
jgi:nucleoside-diphosphate-sugar epimerase